MSDVEKLVGTSMSEIEKLLSTKSVVGDPVTLGDQTIVPLMSVGFAFGAGGMAGKGDRGPKGEGSGEATGGVGGIKPVAVVILDKEGVRVESIRGGASTFVETLGDAVTKVADRRSERKSE